MALSSLFALLKLKQITMAIEASSALKVKLVFVYLYSQQLKAKKSFLRTFHLLKKHILDTLSSNFLTTVVFNRCDIINIIYQTGVNRAYSRLFFSWR